MTETAKERIENEIKSVDKRLHRGRNYGKTYNTGVKEGLMIARAHVIDSSTTDEKTVEKLQERCDRYEKALTEISVIPTKFDDGGAGEIAVEIAHDALAAMSELDKIVDHVVQHEEKRQAEKIKLESEIKALKEVLEHGISTKFVEEEVIYVYSPKTAHEMREKLEENYKQLQPQLTIPKSIADMADKTDLDKIYCFGAQEFYWMFGHDHDKYVPIIFAYLAGKALGIDLVKVVEG